MNHSRTSIRMAGAVAAVLAVSQMSGNAEAQQAWGSAPYLKAGRIASDYKLVFDDEFSGTSLRKDRWTANWLGCSTCITPPVQASNEQAAYDPAQTTVSSGYLNLSLVYKPVTVNGKRYPYRSGMIQSNSQARFTYGYMEARMLLPISGSNNKIANWPAFWMNGQVWPRDGENDVMEGLSGVACNHFHNTLGTTGGCPAGNYTGWHTFGTLWKPGVVEYYYDGIKVGEKTSGVTDQPMYLILNYALGIYGGPARVPSVMKVDYVRVYSNDPNAVAITPDPGYAGPSSVVSRLNGGAVSASKVVTRGTDSAIASLRGTIN